MIILFFKIKAKESFIVVILFLKLHVMVKGSSHVTLLFLLFFILIAYQRFDFYVFHQLKDLNC